MAPQRWTHPPLIDAEKQIRLLSIVIAEGGEASYRTTIWDLEAAPEYNAVSYTWGDVQGEKEVTIDGKIFVVRANCHYALWQCQLQDLSRPLWVDSICINQADLGEKSSQVAMMGRIYEKALTVFACVGPPTKSSIYLQDVVAHGELAAAFDPELEIGTSEWESCIRALDSRLVGDTALCVKDFVVNFTYLQRLWVAQEVYEGRGRLLVLSGRASMSWKNWQKLVFLSDPYFDFTGTARPQGSELPDYFLAMSNLVSTREIVTFPEILTSAQHLQCENPRDRIYGILRLVDWDKDGLVPIDPNYRLSRHDLAVKAMQYSPRKTLANAKLIVHALEVETDATILLGYAT